MLLLDVMQIFEKFYKITGCFVCDFTDVIKICKEDVYCMYCDSDYYFQDDLFISFLVTINFVQENMNN
jgi:hypothetical protein